MICSSVNLDFFIAISLGDGTYPFLDQFAGLRSLGLSEAEMRALRESKVV